MKLKLTEFSEAKVSQEIDLKKHLGDISEIGSISESISQIILDTIIERTESGRDVNGKIFASAKNSKGYSDSYKNSLPFKVYGKTNKINMTLTGDMLSTMFAESDNGIIKIKFDGEQNNAKAYAHISGFKDHPTIKGAKPREFFGITDKELEKITANFKPDLSKEAKANDNIILGKLRKLFGF